MRESWGLQLERFVPLNNSAAVLIFAGDTDMRDIKSMNTLMYQRVKVEPYKVKPTAVTQCKRCLEFGHVKQHCGRTPREPYYVDSDEDGNESTDPALRCCTKCKIPGHTAFQAKCPFFQEEIRKQRGRRSKFKEQRDRVSKQTQQTPPVTHPSTHRHTEKSTSYASVARLTQPQTQTYPQLPTDTMQAQQIMPNANIQAQPAEPSVMSLHELLSHLCSFLASLPLQQTALPLILYRRQLHGSWHAALV